MGNLKEREHLGDLNTDRIDNMKLKWTFKEIQIEDVNWIHLAQEA
jgi:hypothetical protein